MNRIPYSRQWVDDSDIKEIVSVLESDWLTQGPKVKEFERALCEYTGAKYAAAVSNGTAALHLACLAAGVAAGDTVITSPITFAASANCILYCGAKPVFADIDSDTGNIDFDLIEQNITGETKAIIPVDYSGRPANLKEIFKIAKKYSLLVIEDAAHSLGAEYAGGKVGSGIYSDLTTFSFHPVKPITTAEGGAVLTNNKDYYEKLIMLRQHGITKDAENLKYQSQGGWYHEMRCLGYNYRLSDIQCALGISQLKKLDDFIARKAKIVKKYAQAFEGNEYFDLPLKEEGAKSSWHLYPIKLKEKYKDKKALIFNKLREKGIWAQVHYIPVYWHPYYQELGYNKGICPEAEDFYQREISIPLYQSMNSEDIEYTIKNIFEVFKNLI